VAVPASTISAAPAPVISTVGLPPGPIFVAEVGYGGRKGKVVGETTIKGKGMWVVQFEDGMPNRTCYMGSCHSDKKGADFAAFH
jgi:hypothetical protein